MFIENLIKMTSKEADCTCYADKNIKEVEQET